ncbi:hypothetical protein WM40_16620 [Robbsia andropogonis]|uniref:Uncharacterized protein n=1 Tax=Robbsia andropogonis TaxID=28092 RepID=A0A0F5JXL8_9BURK|nr:hypothetical protein WM40_16620 [Robbsia andropogonis]
MFVRAIGWNDAVFSGTSHWRGHRHGRRTRYVAQPVAASARRMTIPRGTSACAVKHAMRSTLVGRVVD